MPETSMFYLRLSHYSPPLSGTLVSSQRSSGHLHSHHVSGLGPHPSPPECLMRVRLTMPEIKSLPPCLSPLNSGTCCFNSLLLQNLYPHGARYLNQKLGKHSLYLPFSYPSHPVMIPVSYAYHVFFLIPSLFSPLPS